MPLHRRLALLAWANEVRGFVLEDDHDSEFRYAGRPLESLQGIDHSDRVLYLGTFSKLVFQALRLGYLVLPKALIETLVTAKAIADCGAPTLEQLVLADFIRDGHLDRHLRRLRARNAARHAALVDAVQSHLAGRVEAWGTNAGLHLALWLPQVGVAELPSLLERAAARGVGLYSLAPFFLATPERAGLLVGFSSLSVRAIQEGIRILADLLP